MLASPPDKKCNGIYRLMLLINFPDASLDDNALFPSKKAISNCVHKSMMKLHYNCINEINNISFIDKWSKEYQEDFIYYQPKTWDDDICGVANLMTMLYHIPCTRNQNLNLEV